MFLKGAELLTFQSTEERRQFLFIQFAAATDAATHVHSKGRYSVHRFSDVTGVQASSKKKWDRDLLADLPTDLPIVPSARPA